MVTELIAYAIAGHHAGLPDMLGASGSLDERLKGFNGDNLDPAWRAEILPNATGLTPRFDFGGDRHDVAFRLAVLGRMIFSCLVDADYRDTEAFYAKAEGRTPDRQWPSLQALLPQLIAAFDSHVSILPKADTTLNRLRGEILASIRSRSAESPGLFTFTVPTGGGKTLASLAFALDHAKAHGLDRIIYVAPFTAIIDQTAEIFRQVLGEDRVLEHHSSIEENAFTSRYGRESYEKLKLAMEDWSAPVIVTTNVQLFESLFAARPSSCRKLHNIARSVIILDEAQTLPRHVLAPCVRVLDELARNYGCSVVLCTATQPALDARKLPDRHPIALNLERRELAPDPANLAVALKRVMIRRAGNMDNPALIAALGDVSQGLIIVNSRKHALALYQEAQAAGLNGLVHLTTRQYASHRRIILSRVRAFLATGEACRVIATSLVEAGVDLDFPRVWRAEAGLDQIAQAAGRCNREGRRRLKDSIVTIFASPDYPAPAEIRGLTGDMTRMAQRHEDLLSPAAISDYFAEVYWRVGTEGLDRNGVLGSFRMDRTGTDFAYRTVAENFHLIENGMVSVIVARDKQAQEAVGRLGIASVPSSAIAREVQIFIVQIPPRARQRLLDNGHVTFAYPDLRGDQFAVLHTDSLYQDATGLIWEDADYLASEALIL